MLKHSRLQFSYISFVYFFFCFFFFSKTGTNNALSNCESPVGYRREYSKAFSSFDLYDRARTFKTEQSCIIITCNSFLKLHNCFVLANCFQIILDRVVAKTIQKKKNSNSAFSQLFYVKKLKSRCCRVQLFCFQRDEYLPLDLRLSGLNRPRVAGFPDTDILISHRSFLHLLSFLFLKH